MGLSSLDANTGKLIVRLSVGCLMLFHGVAKIMHPGSLDFISGMLASNNLPGVLAYGVYIGEVIAPLMVIVGYQARIGGLLMAAGYFALGVRSMPTFYAGLVLLCLGNGLFKPNISAMVGNLYEPGDPRRDAGFNIFYMGINIGAAVSALLAAPIRNLFSFNLAFVAAGVGLLVGVTILGFSRIELGDQVS